jgi:hypothetical protein
VILTKDINYDQYVVNCIAAACLRAVPVLFVNSDLTQHKDSCLYGKHRPAHSGAYF